MILHLLVTEELEPVPEGFKVVEDYGELSIMATADDGVHCIAGRNLVLDGTEQQIKNWLSPFDGVWVGVGPPFMEEFEVLHITED